MRNRKLQNVNTILFFLIVSKDQDPAAFGEEFAVNMRDLFAIRYTLLPYLYTLHYKATAYGHTVVRPLMFE